MIFKKNTTGNVKITFHASIIYGHGILCKGFAKLNIKKYFKPSLFEGFCIDRTQNIECSNASLSRRQTLLRRPGSNFKNASGGQKPFCKKVSGLPKTFVEKTNNLGTLPRSGCTPPHACGAGLPKTFVEKTKKIIGVQFLVLLITLTHCSYRCLHRPFSDFTGAVPAARDFPEEEIKDEKE